MWALDEFVSEQFSVFRRPKGLAGRNNVYPRFGWPVEPWNCSARDAGGEGFRERHEVERERNDIGAREKKKKRRIGLVWARREGAGGGVTAILFSGVIFYQHRQPSALTNPSTTLLPLPPNNPVYSSPLSRRPPLPSLEPLRTCRYPPSRSRAI